MFAVAFDLTVKKAQESHPKGIRAAYRDISSVLDEFGFRSVQGSLYVTDNEDMAVLFQAIQALKEMPWFPAAARDIRAFRIDQWSDFTEVVSGQID